MPSEPPFVVMRTAEQWARATHQDTDLDEGLDYVALAQIPGDSDESASDVQVLAAGGLAFDSGCRLYHGLVEQGRIERVLWGAMDPLHPHRAPEPRDVVGSAPDSVFGPFEIQPSAPTLASRGLAIDARDHLFVVDASSNRILVFDLTARRLIRAISLPSTESGSPRPIAVACHGMQAYVLTEHPTLMFRMSAEAEPSALPLANSARFSRIAASPSGRIAVLDPDQGSVYFPLENRVYPEPGEQTSETPDVQDLAFENEDVVVLARSAGRDFLRLVVGQAAKKRRPLLARGYDGRGIVRAPDGHIGYFTSRGYRTAIEPRAMFAAQGRVTSYRLDSGDWQTAWGRLFVEACLPRETRVRAYCFATDDPPPARDASKLPTNCAAVKLAYPSESPPQLSEFFDPSDADFGPLHPRGVHSELPWAKSPPAPFEILEAPVGQRGRYLFIALELIGNTRRSPKIRSVRAEYPAHDYLRRLPRTFSRDAAAAAFLQRYLAIFEGFLREIEAKSAERATLLHPAATRQELLPWLASFFGLVLDGRFSEAQQRTLIAEIAELWRGRGTLPGIRRWLEIYLGFPPIIVEGFRTRGPGGAVLGERNGPLSALAGTFRVGGTGASGSDASVEQLYGSYAHRFTVIVPVPLGEERRAVVRALLEQQKPAHTAYELCVAGDGMRIGLGLHVALTTVLGSGSGFGTAALGSWQLGADQVVGRANEGVVAGVSKLGSGGAHL